MENNNNNDDENEEINVDIEDLLDAKNKIAGNLTNNVIREFYMNKNNPDSYL